MKREEIIKLAEEYCPTVNLKIHSELRRHEFLGFLKNDNCVGIELGVAGGALLAKNDRKWEV